MMLNQEMRSQGEWLFRWRSYLPMIFFLLFIPAFRTFHYLADSHFADLIWECVCLSIGFSGLWIRCLVVGYSPANTSGRNTKKQIADSLNTTGMYSMVRNPLYLGNFLMWSAPILFLHHGWLYLIYVLAFVIYYERIIAVEESFLAKKFGTSYKDWADKTPLLFPLRWRWRKPETPFSWKTVIRREYHGFYALLLVMTALEFIGDILVLHKMTLDLFWGSLFVFGTIFYLVVRILAKKTQYLKVEGRS
ncbi:MAG: isoprenylcysteine carboxylmethyltransferase family protein [Planctomycetaceae bacterium]|jgi:protein-S-isoprenylcysteine O-methyltransferase Ste14|nr:isoprenylcysteine carboxylmethyltransferase family protein [Planctomycetaceae bacterium]